MKVLFYIAFLLTTLISYSQQIVELCDDEQTTFTYSSPNRLSGLHIWTINPGTNLSSEYFTTNLTYSWEAPGTYNIRLIFISSAGCYDSTFYTVTVTECQKSTMWFPNAFTPNGDKDNETWSPIGYNYSELEYYIYNKWGQLIYKSNSESNPWDGTNCPTDVYIYICYWRSKDKKGFKEFGHLTLIR